MTTSKPRLLVFRGRRYRQPICFAIFFQSGMDVTLLARGNRLTELQKNGLRFSSKGTVQHERVRVIEKLEDHDIYDFYLCACTL
ncbi:ketopantoate reductase family protein [Paenibacillus rhizoplanae]